MGDPAGVGPEVVVKALADPTTAALADWIVVGDRAVLARAEEITGVPVAVPVRDLAMLPASLEGFAFGQLSAACGLAALRYVEAATKMCLAGEVDAMVTAPLNKEAVSLDGIHFSGHTEYIAELCGNADSRMLLVSDRLRVVHVSTHIALRQACNLDSARILKTIEIASEVMPWIGYASPRIAVCGLNPHAGEHGLFGNEDEEIIRPAIAAARAKGIDADGPHAGDTVFLRAVKGQYDLVVAMYHDQGHIPMKLLDFERGINVSIGLPIVRTSVDHGTAFDIAGRNIAEPTSMMCALELGARMARNRMAVGDGRTRYTLINVNQP
ncbi:MAG: 4-hydroxythreonine-4-phosphate dehydrogenase PdxA [Acidobacteria bacterium]|nr:4-hydroxythreonine-4-phosphate dehydrogenase PdxA [Acidobacteriota bacterium]